MTGPNWGPAQRRSQSLTLLLRLWCAHKQGHIFIALQKAQQAAERVKCRYLYPTNGQKLLTPVTELGKSWKKPRRNVTLGKPAVSTNLDPRDLLDTEPPTRQHITVDMRLPKHI